MAQPVNLNRFRKDKARAERKARADENAVKFGQSKADKARITQKNEKAKRRLDDHKSDE